ncbi:hypothetical protein ABT224_30480 [Streptomyces sp. NPDC001584]|uniref:hypothetical protein n=1 Tax=Streptomyces sp. NPDC001584 TaxID=3154521 RepID=UPI0033332873
MWADAALAAPATDGPDDRAVDLPPGAHIPMVRASGVTALRGAGRAAEAGVYLTDRSGLVRACAHRLVRQGGGDPYSRYREPVTDPARVTPYAVSGFAECARREDGPLLRALLGHPGGPVRAAGPPSTGWPLTETARPDRTARPTRYWAHGKALRTNRRPTAQVHRGAADLLHRDRPAHG